LSEADPGDAQKQRDLSILFSKLGDVFLTLGRTGDALTQFEDGLEIRRKLFEANPRDAQKQRDLSFSFNKLGDVFLTLGRTDAIRGRLGNQSHAGGGRSQRRAEAS
jgi:hypothetical protein